MCSRPWNAVTVLTGLQHLTDLFLRGGKLKGSTGAQFNDPEAKVLIWHSLSHLTLLTVRLDRVPVKVLLYKSTNFYVSQTCAFISRKVMKDVFLILTAQIKFLFELKKKKQLKNKILSLSKFMEDKVI